MPDRGPCITVAVQTAVHSGGGNAPKAEEDKRIELVGLISNRDGETVASFADSLIPLDNPENPAQEASSEWRYTGLAAVSPGIYQVRVAVRDARTGRSGTALQWVEVPEFSASKFSLGNIVLTEDATGSQPTDALREFPKGDAVSIRRRFGRSSQSSFFMRVYNPSSASLQAQTRIFRGNRMVWQSPFAPLQEQLPAEAGRLLLRGVLSLAELEPGDYTLEILVKNSSANPAATQRIRFWIQ